MNVGDMNRLSNDHLMFELGNYIDLWVFHPEVVLLCQSLPALDLEGSQLFCFQFQNPT